MMQAGKLDRTIVIERSTHTLDSYGAPQVTWATLVTLRAQLLEGTTEESQEQDRGAATTQTVSFKTRYAAGITVADRLTYEGATFNIKQIKEIGRRRGLEFTAEKIGP